MGGPKPEHLYMEGQYFPMDEYLKDRTCVTEVDNYVVARTRVIHGDPSFCNTLLRAKYTLIDLDLPHTILEDDANKYLSLGGASTEVYPLAGNFDINNDGERENIGWIKAYSPAGRGCDIERFVQLDAKRAHIANTKLTEMLGATCSSYYRAFRFEGRTYLENRRFEPYYYTNILKEVVALDGDKRRVVCEYAYNPN